MKKKMTFYEKVNAQGANPVNFLLHIVGFVGGAYYLWIANWEWAVLFGIGLPVVGHVYAWFTEKGKAVPNSMLRELMYSHSEPVNAVLHFIGLVLAIMGFWNHDFVYLGGAVVLCALGHLFGATLMTDVAPKMVKRLTVMDMMLVKYSSLAFGLLIGAYASDYVVMYRWWVLAFVLVFAARPFAHFFLKD